LKTIAVAILFLEGFTFFSWWSYFRRYWYRWWKL